MYSAILCTHTINSVFRRLDSSKEVNLLDVANYNILVKGISKKNIPIIPAPTCMQVENAFIEKIKFLKPVDLPGLGVLEYYD